MITTVLPTLFHRSLILTCHQQVFKRFAGHSKWANIKHTKGLKDAQRGRLFTKLGHQIKVAIQEGGSINPAHNLRLEQVIKQCKRHSMPAATIENVIKSTKNDKNQYKYHLFEIRGPGGCIIICELSTPHLIKTRNNIAGILKKHSSKFNDGGKSLFERKGIIETEILSQEKAANSEEILEKAMSDAVECDAEDVQLLEENKLLQFICAPTSFPQVQKKLENLNYKIVSASLEYIPNMEVLLSDSDLGICESLFDKLESMDEVVKLHDNIA